MKKIFCISIISIIILTVCSFYSKVSATERLVDIPVPPDNHGMADFTENEAAEIQNEYEQSKNNTVDLQNNEQGTQKNNYFLVIAIIIIIFVFIFIIIRAKKSLFKDKK